MAGAIFRERLLVVGNRVPRRNVHAVIGMVILALALLVSVGLAGQFDVTRAGDSGVPNSAPAVAVPAPATTVPAPEAQAGRDPLTPTMKAALGYVAQRYRVSADALGPVFEEVQSVGRERQLDPLLLVAVISIESRFNPFSQSTMGAQGLMQIIPRYHQDKLPSSAAGDQPFLDPVTNVRMGARILQEAIHRQGGLIEGLQYYGGATFDLENSYANKVLAERLRIEQAVRRGDST